MSKKCPVCGAGITDNAYVCLFCGCHVRAATSVSPITGQQPPLPPVSPVYAQSGPAPVKRRSRVSAGVLGIVVGALGVHNFYLGYIGRGLIQLLVSVLGFGLTDGLSAVAMGTWALIEGILILTDRESVDANGNSLRD